MLCHKTREAGLMNVFDENLQLQTNTLFLQLHEKLEWVLDALRNYSIAYEAIGGMRGEWTFIAMYCIVLKSVPLLQIKLVLLWIQSVSHSLDWRRFLLDHEEARHKVTINTQFMLMIRYSFSYNDTC